MKSKKPTFLPGEVLERLAAEEPAKVPLWDYRAAMDILREKDFSYQDIANWLNERLGTEVTRNQVAYVLNAHLPQ